MFYTYQTVTELKLAYNYNINHNQLQHQSEYSTRIMQYYGQNMHNIMHDIQYIPIFNISIQFKLCRYCITGLMYHNMAIYRYIVASLVYTYVLQLRIKSIEFT